jgi:hypothetical protein
VEKPRPSAVALISMLYQGMVKKGQKPPWKVPRKEDIQGQLAILCDHLPRAENSEDTSIMSFLAAKSAVDRGLQ